MGEVILIRHGQANSASQDEASYDRLSELGRQQSRWLGDWLRAHEAPFDRVLTGTLRRHRQTAEALGAVGPAPQEDARLNEMDYFNLGRALQDHCGRPMPQAPEEFATHVVEVLEAWHRAEIRGQESFDAFEARVTQVVEEAATPGLRVLCVTSGGVIGMVMRHFLRLDPRRMAHVLMPIRNSSVHRVDVAPHGTLVSGFNATPHLDAPDRAHARTTY
ncbi:histidine phosphatase family protein [Psychromarinibacter sp. C21-152]|uniref:Histidine phosphatase family protein n=1 Tax=Psychromarinibacter sediminicola TaxID=3033385 RepID=A0AAE3NTL2_9RHOB|nr:histidine phosphatase family protein [Psychromarinibacter sediminicola]MDF0601827.1 histidine phosphatase family protein [Psychromarinibacter sediminicola]